MAVELRPMTPGDLALVEGWLREPHVARWWLSQTTLEDELAEIRAELEKLSARLDGSSPRPTRLLLALERAGAADPRPIGWCQWYPYLDFPQEAAAVGARPGDCGIDYAIGDPGAPGRGLGTQLIGALVREVRRHHPGCGIVVDPEAGNAASRRVLERNGFGLLAVRPVLTEPGEQPMAIYRLPGTAG